MMDDSAELLDLLRDASRGLPGPESCDAWELSARICRQETCRVATSRILHAQHALLPTLRVRLWSGRCWATAETDLLDPLALAHAVKRSLRLLAHAPRLEPGQRQDPSLPGPMESLSPGAGSELYCALTAAEGASWRFGFCKKLLRALSRDGLEAYGVLRCDTNLLAVVNSRQVATWHRNTSSRISIDVLDGRGHSGHTSALCLSINGLLPEEIAQEAGARVLSSRSWEQAEAGPCLAVLEPTALAPLLSLVLLGPQLGSSGSWTTPDTPVELRSFGPSPPGKAPGCAADEQGRPLQAGRVARLEDLRPTSSQPMEGCDLTDPLFLEMVGGQTSLRDILAGIDRGIWVSRLHGPVLVQDSGPDPLLLASTSGGSFAIRKGRPGRRLEELQLRCRLGDLLAGIEGVSQERRALPWEEGGDGAMVLPTVLVHGLSFGT